MRICKKKITLGNVYRPSKSHNDYQNVATFNNEFEPIIDRLDRENSILIFGGDYNANLLEICEKDRYQELFDMFVSKGAFPKITLPTRFATRRATLLDNIFCKLPDSSIQGTSGIFVSKVSDHFPVFTCLELFKSNKQRTKYVTVQEKSRTAIERFTQFIQKSIQDTAFDSELISDPNHNYNKLEDIIVEGNKRFFSRKKEALQQM